MVTDLLNREATLAATGWSSSSSLAFDFRANGNALPLYILFAVSLAIFSIGVVRLRRRLGSRATGDDTSEAGRVGRLLRHALLQTRIRRGGDLGWIHLPLFWGVVVLGLGSLTILVDAYLLQPLGLGPPRGTGYRIFQAGLDLFGVAFLLGVVLAIFRRTLLRPERKPADPGMVVILLGLLGLGVGGFALEGLRMHLEGGSEPWAFAGTAVAALISRVAPTAGSGAATYQVLWWSHVVVAFGLFAAVPFTALRHVLTTPANILAASEQPRGALDTPFSLKELLATGNFDIEVGADSIEDLSHRERLGFLACADSGHCEEACPAHAAGTPLSPSRFVRALRDDPEALQHEALSEDAIWSCTLCGACAQVCPALVDPTETVVRLRRGLVAGNRQGPARTAVLANLTHARNPYGSNEAARADLRTALGGSEGDTDLLYWVGCAATFDARARKVVEATARILTAAGIRFDVLGSDEACCGDPARRIGEEGLFQDLAGRNIEAIERHGAPKVLTHCAHCFNTLRNEYPGLGARFEVAHHATFIDRLIREGAIRPVHGDGSSLTLHDACYVGRFNEGVAAPRSILGAIPGARLTEMTRSGARTFCCGAGGGNYWYDVPRREKIATVRSREAAATGAATLVTECPFCLKMLEDSSGPEGMPVRDIAEVLAESLGGSGSHE